jgi:hypothetical protein
VKRDIVRYKQKELDLNKDKDNYGKNSRVDIPTREFHSTSGLGSSRV